VAGAPAGLAAFEPVFPTAVIGLPSEIVAGTPATLSSAASRDANPGALFSSWSWAFGDGSANSSAAAPVHTFAVPGEYTVKLSLVDDYGLASATASGVAHVITQAEAEAKAKIEEEDRLRESERLAHEPPPVTPSTPPPTPASSEAATVKTPAGDAASTSGVSASHSAAAPVPVAQLGGSALRVSRSGKLRMRLMCPAGVNACAGTVLLRVHRRAPAAAGHGHSSPEALFAAAFSIPGGQVSAIVLRLDPAAVGALERAHSERALATIDSDVPPGGSHTVASVVTLQLGSRRHRAR
jgi:hypothetical protein